MVLFERHMHVVTQIWTVCKFWSVLWRHVFFLSTNIGRQRVKTYTPTLPDESAFELNREKICKSYVIRPFKPDAVGTLNIKLVDVVVGGLASPVLVATLTCCLIWGAGKIQRMKNKQMHHCEFMFLIRTSIIPSRCLVKDFKMGNQTYFCGLSSFHTFIAAALQCECWC